MSVRKPELYVPHCKVRTLCSMLRQSWKQASGSFTITVYMYTSHNCHVYELEAAVVLCGQIQPKITPCETKAGQHCYRETSQRRWACWLLNFLRIPDHTIFPQSHTKMTELFSYLFEAQCAYVYLVRKATYQLIHPPLVHQNGKMALLIQPHSLSGVTLFTSSTVFLNPSYSMNLLGCRCVEGWGFCRLVLRTTSSTAPSVWSAIFE